MRLPKILLGALTALVVGALLTTPADAQTSRPKGGDEKDKNATATPLDLGPFSAPLAAGWKKEEPSSRMRRAQASLPAPKDGGTTADLVVFHFPGTGGTVDANLTRWKGQFEKPEGMEESEFAKTTEKRVDGLPVTILEVRGKYIGSRMPGRPAPTPIDDAKMVAVIVETSEGPYFIKITGPRATVEHHAKGIDAMVAGVKRGPKEPEGKKKDSGKKEKPASRPRGR